MQNSSADLDSSVEIFFSLMERKARFSTGRGILLGVIRGVCAERGLNVEIPDGFDFSQCVQTMRTHLGWATKHGHDFFTLMGIWGVPDQGEIASNLVVALTHQLSEVFPHEQEGDLQSIAIAWGVTFARQWHTSSLGKSTTRKMWSLTSPQAILVATSPA